MPWIYVIFILPLLIVAIVSAILARAAWRCRPVLGAKPFAFFMLGLSVWSLAYGFELAGQTFAAQVFWNKVKYFGIVFVPLMALTFSAQFTGHRRWVSRRKLFLLSIIPLVSLILLWTNEYHYLFLHTIEQRFDRPIPMLRVVYGPAFWLHTAYSYLLFWTSILLLLYMFLFRATHQARKQIIAIVVGGLSPWIANVVTIFKLAPLPYLYMDLTPFAFSFTGLALAWGLLRFQLLDIVPIAHTAVFRGITDGVIILDVQNRIVDLNPAAQRLIRSTPDLLLGELARDALAEWTQLIPYVKCSQKETNAVIQQKIDDVQCHFDVRITPIYSRRYRAGGRLIILRDITKRQEAERALKARKQQLRKWVDELREVNHQRLEVITHLRDELHTPLANIKAHIEQMPQDIADDRASKLNALYQEVGNLQQIIDNCLDSSQLEDAQKYKQLGKNATYLNGHGNSPRTTPELSL